MATLKHTLELAEECLSGADTNPDLLDCIMEYAHGQGGNDGVNLHRARPTVYPNGKGAGCNRLAMIYGGDDQH